MSMRHFSSGRESTRSLPLQGASYCGGLILVRYAVEFGRGAPHIVTKHRRQTSVAFVCREASDAVNLN